MNAMSHTPAVIARWNPLNNKPLVFLADSLPSDTWKAFEPGRGVIEVSNDVYRSTEPLSAEDTNVVVAEFKKFANVETVHVRQRAKYQKMKKLVNRIANDTGMQIDQENLVQSLDKVPQNVQNVISQMADKPKRAYTKRQVAAVKRTQEDAVRGAVVTMQQLGTNPTEEQVKAATEELGKKLAEMLAATILNAK